MLELENKIKLLEQPKNIQEEEQRKNIQEEATKNKWSIFSIFKGRVKE